MEWWEKMMVPMKGAWGKVAQCLRFKKKGAAGIVKLRHDVRTCEYEDVRILWEMLKKNDVKLDTSGSRSRRKKGFNKVVEWAKCAPLLCHHGG